MITPQNLLELEADMSIIIKLYYILNLLRYWHQRADERHGNPPQGNQETKLEDPR